MTGYGKFKIVMPERGVFCLKMKSIEVIYPGKIIKGVVTGDRKLSTVEMQVHHIGDDGKKVVIGPVDNNRIAGITTDEVLWNGGEAKVGRLGTVIITGSLGASSEK